MQVSAAALRVAIAAFVVVTTAADSSGAALTIQDNCGRGWIIFWGVAYHSLNMHRAFRVLTVTPFLPVKVWVLPVASSDDTSPLFQNVTFDNS